MVLTVRPGELCLSCWETREVLVVRDGHGDPTTFYVCRECVEKAFTGGQMPPRLVATITPFGDIPVD